MLCSMGTLTLAQSAKPRVVEMHPGEEYSSAIVIPAASPLVIASVRPEESTVTFSGRFTLSGDYMLELFEEEMHLTMWPDKKSRSALPYWRDRGVPDEIYISDAQAFAEAVLTQPRLAKLKAQQDAKLRGF